MMSLTIIWFREIQLGYVTSIPNVNSEVLDLDTIQCKF